MSSSDIPLLLLVSHSTPGCYLIPTVFWPLLWPDSNYTYRVIVVNAVDCDGVDGVLCVCVVCKLFVIRLMYKYS